MIVPEKLKRSLRRFRRRNASLHRKLLSAIQERIYRPPGSYPVIRRGAIRGIVRSDFTDRQPTRQEIQHQVDWQQSRSDIGLS